MGVWRHHVTLCLCRYHMCCYVREVDDVTFASYWLMLSSLQCWEAADKVEKTSCDVTVNHVDQKWCEDGKKSLPCWWRRQQRGRSADANLPHSRSLQSESTIFKVIVWRIYHVQGHCLTNLPYTRSLYNLWLFVVRARQDYRMIFASRRIWFDLWLAPTVWVTQHSCESARGLSVLLCAHVGQ